MKKTIIVLAGCNGAGKTTAAYRLLTDFLRNHIFLNADLLALSISEAEQSTKDIKASRLFLEQAKQLIVAGQSFALESTLSSKTLFHLLLEAKNQGYALKLIYLFLSSADLAVKRVKIRVKEGGHDIPESVIRRRYQRSIYNLLNRYNHLFNEVHCYDNSMPELKFLGNHELLADANSFRVSLENQIGGFVSESTTPYHTQKNLEHFSAMLKARIAFFEVSKAKNRTLCFADGYGGIISLTGNELDPVIEINQGKLRDLEDKGIQAFNY